MHNAEEYINHALKSIEMQKYKDFECIIIDDHSTDNSKKIVETFKENFPKLILKIYATEQEKWGPGAARNIGLKTARGEYILFLDADDSLKDNNALKRLDEIINAHKNTEIILLGHLKVWFNRKEKMLRKKAYLPKERNADIHYQIGRNNEGIIWSCCFKRELFEKYNIKFPENTIWEDLIPKLILFSKAKQEKIKICPYIIHQYNIRPGKSIGTTPSIAKMKSLITMYKKVANLIIEQKMDIKYKKDLKKRIRRMPIVLVWMCNRLLYVFLSNLFLKK